MAAPLRIPSSVVRKRAATSHPGDRHSEAVSVIANALIEMHGLRDITGRLGHVGRRFDTPPTRC